MTALRKRMLEDMQIRNLSPLTQYAYTGQVARYARHFDKCPSLLGPEEIRDYGEHENPGALSSCQISLSRTNRCIH